MTSSETCDTPPLPPDVSLLPRYPKPKVSCAVGNDNATTTTTNSTDNKQPNPVKEVNLPAGLPSDFKAGMMNIPVSTGGIFCCSEDVAAEKSQMDALLNTDPLKARELFQKYEAMTVSSGKGELTRTLALLASTGRGPPPIWFAVKMFKAGIMKLNLSVSRFMVRNGFNCHIPPLKNIVHELIANNANDHRMFPVESGACTKKEEMIRDRRYVEMICFLLVECEFDANPITIEEFHTPLHICAKYNLQYMTIALTNMGGDVNAISKSDELPLKIAIDSGSKECEDVLRKRGGRLTWRKDVDKYGLPATIPEGINKANGWKMVERNFDSEETVVKLKKKKGLNLSLSTPGELQQLDKEDDKKIDEVEEVSGMMENMMKIVKADEEDEGAYSFSCGE